MFSFDYVSSLSSRDLSEAPACLLSMHVIWAIFILTLNYYVAGVNF